MTTPQSKMMFIPKQKFERIENSPGLQNLSQGVLHCQLHPHYEICLAHLKL